MQFADLPTMLEPLSIFSLASHAGPYEQWPLRTRLLVNGVETGASIPGYILEGQYRCAEGYLLIASWDCPFEESYDFILLNHTFRRLSRTSLGVPYGSFLLHAHWPLDDRSVRLHFYTAMTATLRILPAGGWFRRTPRLRLERHLIAPPDERTQVSIAELATKLAAIDTSLAGTGDGDSR